MLLVENYRSGSFNDSFHAADSFATKTFQTEIESKKQKSLRNVGYLFLLLKGLSCGD